MTMAMSTTSMLMSLFWGAMSSMPLLVTLQDPIEDTLDNTFSIFFIVSLVVLMMGEPMTRFELDLGKCFESLDDQKLWCL